MAKLSGVRCTGLSCQGLHEVGNVYLNHVSPAEEPQEASVEDGGKNLLNIPVLEPVMSQQL
jgi:hypothetical protein